RGRELVRDALVERGAAPARGIDLVLHAGVDLARGHDPRALRARDGPAERTVADVGDEVVKRACRLLLARLLFRRAWLLVLLKPVGIARAHVTRIRAAVLRLQETYGCPFGP